jgi:hypothetical protein
MSFATTKPRDAEPEHHAAVGERDKRLWINVLLQALQDAKSTYSKEVYDRDQARSWLTGNSKDFREVCEMAGVCPIRARRMAEALIKEADASAPPPKPPPPPKPKFAHVRRYEFDGKNQTISQWCRELKIAKGTLQSRIEKGWPPERIFSAVKMPGKKLAANAAAATSTFSDNTGENHG